jgi:hypothetical protein
MYLTRRTEGLSDYWTIGMSDYWSESVLYILSVPDLTLRLCVLKHRAPLTSVRRGGGASSCDFFFKIDFCLSGAILKE